MTHMVVRRARVTMRSCFNLILPQHLSHTSVRSAWMDPLMQYGCVDTSSAWIVQNKSRMQPGFEEYATFAGREPTPTLIVSCREDTRFKTIPQWTGGGACNIEQLNLTYYRTYQTRTINTSSFVFEHSDIV